MKKQVAIIIPTYNEVVNCAVLISQIFKVLPNADVIISDDQSPDGTAQEVERLSEQYPSLHLVSNSTKNGRGAAVRSGWEYAIHNTPAQYFVEMDADLSHRPEELLKLLAAVRTDTVALASRYLSESKIENWSWKRKVFSKLSNSLISISTGLPLTDNTNGFRAYPNEAIEKLLNHGMVTKSYLSLTESAVILKRHGFHFREVSSQFPNRVRGVSNTTLSEVRANLLDLVYLVIRYKRGCTCHD